jgi:hypothetical protein
MAENIDFLGKKIFFLYPSAVVQNRIIEEFTQQEFEVYMVKDHIKMKGFLRKNPDSIVFVNINDGLNEKDWEVWIRGILEDNQTARVGIGVISSEENEELKQKYLNNLKITCGFTVFRSDLNLVMKQLFSILIAADAKGRRKYIRAIISENETNTVVNFSLNGTFVKGMIKDISVVGFSCVFADDPELTKNSLFPDIQIKLQSSILKAEGIVFGSRMDEKTKIYVVLFTQRMDPEARVKIRKYIQSNLQAKLDFQLR